MSFINSYNFGKIVIDDQEYNHDVIITSEKILSWQRQESHLVSLKDIKEIIKAQPKIVIFGTGAYGVMKISHEALDYFKEQEIQTVILHTKQAGQTYNQLEDKTSVVAALHLTC